MKYRKKGNKKVRNAKLTIYDGIKFKSKLEARTYQLLKEAGLEYDYEKHKYVLLPSFTSSVTSYEQVGKLRELKLQSNKVQRWTYTPDFTSSSSTKDNIKWVIETKGNITPRDRLKWKMFKRHLEDEGQTPTIFMPRNITQVREVINLIKSKL